MNKKNLPHLKMPAPTKVSMTTGAGLLQQLQQLTGNFQNPTTQPTPGPSTPYQKAAEELGDIKDGSDINDEQTPEPLINVFEWLEVRTGHKINLLQPLDEDIDWEWISDSLEAYAADNWGRENVTDIKNTPGDTLDKGAMMIIFQKISDLVDQDPDFRSDGEVLDDIVRYLKSLNLYRPL